jgi:hypothetical protein
LWTGYGYFVLGDNGQSVVVTNGVGAALMVAYLCAFVYVQKDTEHRAKILSITGAIIGTQISTFACLFLLKLPVNSPGTVLASIALVFNIFMYAAPLTAVYDAVKKLDASFVSAPLAVTSLLCSLDWAVFGLLIADAFVVTPNVVGAVLGCVQLACLAYVARRRTKAIVTAIGSPPPPPPPTALSSSGGIARQVSLRAASAYGEPASDMEALQLVGRSANGSPADAAAVGSASLASAAGAALRRPSYQMSDSPVFRAVSSASGGMVPSSSTTSLTGLISGEADDRLSELPAPSLAVASAADSGQRRKSGSVSNEPRKRGSSSNSVGGGGGGIGAAPEDAIRRSASSTTKRTAALQEAVAAGVSAVAPKLRASSSTQYERL